MITLQELVEKLASERHLRKRHARQFLLGYIWSCLYESEREHIVNAVLLSKEKNLDNDTRWGDPPAVADIEIV
jgi:hypothetical protein